MIPNRGGARQSTVGRHYFAQLLPPRLATRLNGYEIRGRPGDDGDFGARPLRPQAFDLLGISGGARVVAFRAWVLTGTLAMLIAAGAATVLNSVQWNDREARFGVLQGEPNPSGILHYRRPDLSTPRHDQGGA